MYRLVFIILILYIIESEQCSKLNKWEKKKPLWKRKQEIKEEKQELLEIESHLEMLCNEGLNKSEIYSRNDYTLKYHIPGVDIENVKLETLYRLLSASIGVTGEGHVTKYVEDVHLLPVSVNTSDAFWNIEDDSVVITFLYKFKCNTEANSVVESKTIEFNSMAVPFSMLR